MKAKRAKTARVYPAATFSVPTSMLFDSGKDAVMTTGSIARAYPAESDPRQAVGVDRFARDIQRIAASLLSGNESDSRQPMSPDYFERLERFRLADAAALAREFGPWVRCADGRWQRDRRKR